MAEERIEDGPDDDAEGHKRRVSNQEPDPAPEDDVEGAKRSLGETEEDVEGHGRKR
jgi:hypothetical protein